MAARRRWWWEVVVVGCGPAWKVASFAWVERVIEVGGLPAVGWAVASKEGFGRERELKEHVLCRPLRLRGTPASHALGHTECWFQVDRQRGQPWPGSPGLGRHSPARPSSVRPDPVRLGPAQVDPARVDQSDPARPDSGRLGSVSLGSPVPARPCSPHPDLGYGKRFPVGHPHGYSLVRKERVAHRRGRMGA